VRRRRLASRLALLGLVLGTVASASLTAVAQPAAGRPAAAPPAAESCATCHLEIGDERLAAPVKAFGRDIHAAKGFGCTACHGGDPKEAGMEAMDPAKGYVGKPGRREILQVCGRCHSDARFMRRYNPALRVDQVTEYLTSVHGRRLRDTGDPKVAVCTSCHPAHSITPPSDPQSSVHPLRVAETCGRCHADPGHMAGYKIPTDQKQRYQGSVHWATMSQKGDLSAPTCNDCHGNHGAAPPGVSWVGNVCGQCHAVMAEFFAKSPHAKAFTQMGVPGCAGCHENHEIKPATDAMLGMGDGAVCAGCHAPDDKGGSVAVRMRALIDGLAADHGRAQTVLSQAEHAGMEVSQAQFDLNGAKDALVKARTAVHAFALAAVQKEAEAGMAVAARAHARGVRALEELRFRRLGLAVSVAIILALIVGLVLKIRELDRRAARESPAKEDTR
jgi:predicted CXXCH cytochrome family protein